MDLQEFSRWIAMAERTLASAVRDMEAGDYNWACFKAHQAGEFAVKAVLYGVGRPTRGHSVARLLRELSSFVAIDEGAFEDALLLDKFYVPTRYVDAWSEGVPYEYFTKHDAELAIGAARRVIGLAKELWRSLGGGKD